MFHVKHYDRHGWNVHDFSVIASVTLLLILKSFVSLFNSFLFILYCRLFIWMRSVTLDKCIAFY